MSAVNSISPEKLSRLVGTASCPALIDVRPDEEFAENPILIPGSLRFKARDVGNWEGAFRGRRAVVICERGAAASEGIAARLRYAGISADLLEGGIHAWTKEGLPSVRANKIPDRDKDGRTIWVTRERPKIDRIACPWLIRRFIDPSAVFLFVAPSQVIAVGKQFGATPFDIEDVEWGHRGELCTFDVMVEEFGLKTEPLLHLATMVRAADTARLDLIPEASGLLAASLGLSRIYSDDLEQLQAGMTLYDAFYRWCRDATGESHSWPHQKARAKA
jgi:rhodanese-related sulfurtransferase